MVNNSPDCHKRRTQCAINKLGIFCCCGTLKGVNILLTSTALYYELSSFSPLPGTTNENSGGTTPWPYVNSQNLFVKQGWKMVMKFIVDTINMHEMGIWPFGACGAGLK